LGNEEFGINRMIEITKIPNTCAFVEGVALDALFGEAAGDRLSA
jgi:hypothetical protein